MPRPKTGTVIIKREGNKTLAYIRNQGGQEFPAEGLGDILRDFHGKVCTFMARGGKIQQVSVGGTTHDTASDRPEVPPKEKLISAGEAWQLTGEKQEDYSSKDMPEPDLAEVALCQKRKPMLGTNLFSGNPKSLRIPVDTASLIQQLFTRGKGESKPLIDNFSLLLNRSVHFGDVGKQGKPEFLHEHLQDGKGKPFIFRQTFDDRSGNQKAKRKFEIEFDFQQDLIDHVNRRQESLRASWQLAGWQVRSSRFTPDFRLVMGLGTASVFETSLTLHHVYGIPYLPASSIKGVARSWVIINQFSGDEKAAMRDPLFAYLFGSDTKGPGDKAHRGHVMFFDAFPQSPPVIEPDIMNVHYPEWYSTGKAPTDTQSPNPIPFLTVGKCDANQQPLQVRFDLACDEKRSIGEVLQGAKSRLADASEPRMPLELAHDYLKSALTEHGIGAKTAVGYGFFQSP